MEAQFSSSCPLPPSLSGENPNSVGWWRSWRRDLLEGAILGALRVVGAVVVGLVGGGGGSVVLLVTVILLVRQWHLFWKLFGSPVCVWSDSS